MVVGWIDILEKMAMLTSTVAQYAFLPNSYGRFVEYGLYLTDSIKTNIEAMTTLWWSVRALVSFYPEGFSKNLHASGREKTDDTQFLLPVEPHLHHRDNRQDNNDTVQHTMHQNAPEEEAVGLKGAMARYVLIPDVVHGSALKNKEKGAEDDPEGRCDEEYDDGDSDRGDFEEFPVKGQDA